MRKKTYYTILVTSFNIEYLLNIVWWNWFEWNEMENLHDKFVCFDWSTMSTSSEKHKTSQFLSSFNLVQYSFNTTAKTNVKSKVFFEKQTNYIKTRKTFSARFAVVWNILINHRPILMKSKFKKKMLYLANG